MPPAIAAAPRPSYAERLRLACSAADAPWALGLDPNPDLFWPEFAGRFDLAGPKGLAQAMQAWCMEALEAVGKRAAAVKPQAAWFEVAGAEGMAALESLLRQCRNEGLLLIGDAKRGDIGVSSQAYARAWLAPGAPLECDALTVNPWLGGDAMQPLVQAAHCHGKGIYALARTSNPGSAAWQTVRDEAGEPLWARVAEGMQGILPGPHTGFVVGASCIDEGAQLRERHPQAPLLVPGLGAQGADFSGARHFAGGEGAAPAVFPTSRAVLFPPQDGQGLGGLKGAMGAAADGFLEQLSRGLAG